MCENEYLFKREGNEQIEWCEYMCADEINVKDMQQKRGFVLEERKKEKELMMKEERGRKEYKELRALLHM